MPDEKEKIESAINKSHLATMQKLLSGNPRLHEVFQSTPVPGINGNDEDVLDVDLDVSSQGLGESLQNSRNLFEHFTEKQLIVQMSDCLEKLNQPKNDFASEEAYFAAMKRNTEYLDSMMDIFKQRESDYKSLGREYNMDEGRMFDNMHNIINAYEEGKKAVDDYFQSIEENKLSELEQKVRQKSNDFIDAENRLEEKTRDMKKELGTKSYAVYLNGEAHILNFQNIAEDPQYILNPDNSDTLIRERKNVVDMKNDLLQSLKQDLLDAQGNQEKIALAQEDGKKKLELIDQLADNNTKIANVFSNMRAPLGNVQNAARDLSRARRELVDGMFEASQNAKLNVINNSAKSREDMMNALLGTKKAFGDSKYFENVKKQITEFQKINEQFTKGEGEPRSWDDMTDNLLKALKEYKAQRDIGTKRKSTAVGQKRIDTVNALIESIEATREKLSVISDSKDLNPPIARQRLLPKSQLEANMLFDSPSGLNVLDFKKQIPVTEELKRKESPELFEEAKKVKTETVKKQETKSSPTVFDFTGDNEPKAREMI